MKRIILTLFIGFVGLSYAFGQGWGEWQHYSYITNGDKKVIEIQYKTYYSKNYYPKVKWQLINLTSNTYYDVGLGNRVYTYSNGTRKTSGPEGMRTIEPRETEGFISDTHCCDGNRITNVQLNHINMRTERSGERYKVDTSN